MATSTLISPGVLALENDNSFISQQPVTVGAALIGPTVKGPVEVPTIVTSWSDYQNKFGTTFLSGSQVYTYFTSIAAFNYFNNGGQTLLVARVASGSFTSADSTPIVNSNLATTASVIASSASLANFITPTGSFSINGITIAVTGSTTPANTATTIFIPSGSTPANTVIAISASLAVSRSVAPYSSSIRNILTTTADTNRALLFQASSSINGSEGNSFFLISGSTTNLFTGGVNSGSGTTTFNENTTIPLYVTSASLSSGVVLFYPVSIVIPQQ